MSFDDLTSIVLSNSKGVKFERIGGLQDLDLIKEEPMKYQHRVPSKDVNANTIHKLNSVCT